MQPVIARITWPDAEHLKAFDAALNPEGRLILRSAAERSASPTNLVRQVGSGDFGVVDSDRVSEEDRTRVGA